MFIGNVEKTNYEFARPKGAKDRKPRSKRSMLATGSKIAGGLAGAGAIGYAGIKNRKAIGAGLGKAGGFARDVAMVGEMKARQMGRKGMNKARQGASAVGRGAENLRARTARAGYGAADRVGGAVAGARSAIAGGKAELNKRVMRKLPKNQRPQ